jgi:hypothetical protein
VARFAVVIPRLPDYPHSHAFDEVALALVDGLVELGHDAIASDHASHPDRRCVILGPQLLQHWRQPVPDDAILYNLEQVDRGSAWITRELIERFRRHPLWDFSARNQQALANDHGIEHARLLPLGHVPALERIAPQPYEDVDVLFYGSPNDRRIDVLEQLERRGARVMPLFGVYGRERDAWIARSKIVLNMHYYEAQVFEQVRVSYLLANERFVVSETGDAEGEAAWQGGLVFARFDDLVGTCLDHLARPAERDRIRRQGRALMRARPQREFLRAVLAESDQPG